MAEERMPYQIIDDLVAEWGMRSDDDVLAALASLPPLADESDPCWENDGYWHRVAYPYLALAGVCANRRLRSAIKLLLDRACFGDPGEIMRGLRHSLEAIVNPDWAALTEVCLTAAQSDRPGTRLWAIDELTVLEDPRAKPLFEEAIRNAPRDIRWRAEFGLERLRNKGLI